MRSLHFRSQYVLTNCDIIKFALIKYYMKFLTLKKRTLCAILVAIIAICSIVGVCYAVKATSSPKAVHTIVIDAGHGGVDVKLGQYIKQKRHIG